jgi:hypothetical protein
MNFKTNVLSIIIAFTLVLTGAAYYGTGFASAEAGGTAFTDLPSTHWAYESVKKMQEKEIIKGYADGTFRPSQTVTYGEFIKMTITALDGKDDVAEVASPTHWASKYYKAALNRNLFSSGQIAEKSLNLSIPRYDMALIAANAVNAGDVNNYEELMESLPDVDTKTVNSYQILQAYAEGMITGYEDSTFRAFGTLSRAEASTVILRIIDKSARKVPEWAKEVTEEKETTSASGNTSQWLTDSHGQYKMVKLSDYIKSGFIDVEGARTDWYLPEDMKLYKDGTLKGEITGTNEVAIAANFDEFSAAVMAVMDGKLYFGEEAMGFISGYPMEHEMGIVAYFDKMGIKDLSDIDYFVFVHTYPDPYTVKETVTPRIYTNPFR